MIEGGLTIVIRNLFLDHDDSEVFRFLEQYMVIFLDFEIVYGLQRMKHY